MSHIIQSENATVQIDLEFLDHTFKIEVSKEIDLEELFEIIEKFILENPAIAIDLKTLSKTILDTEYYSLILKQNEILIDHFNQIKIGIPVKLELESDDVKRRYFTKKHLKSTLSHLDSISIGEFVNIFQITNVSTFKQNLLSLEPNYPIKIEDDIIRITQPLDKVQTKNLPNKLLEFMT